jgi:hypothetical protein
MVLISLLFLLIFFKSSQFTFKAYYCCLMKSQKKTFSLQSSLVTCLDHTNLSFPYGCFLPLKYSFRIDFFTLTLLSTITKSFIPSNFPFDLETFELRFKNSFAFFEVCIIYYTIQILCALFFRTQTFDTFIASVLFIDCPFDIQSLQKCIALI